VFPYKIGWAANAYRQEPTLAPESFAVNHQRYGESNRLFWNASPKPPEKSRPAAHESTPFRKPSLQHYVRATELKAAGMDRTEVLAESELLPRFHC
jgi:hypothetical protein